jgi:tripartite-type tricarboxylate transporter receptor subunit TctC
MFRSLIFTSALAGAFIAFVLPAFAQSDYPNRVVKIVNPFAAGSAPDILARGLAASLSTRLGQQFIVENRVGGSGAVGTQSVVRADPDGYTLLFAPALVLSVLPQARNDTGYKPDSLVPVCQVLVNSMALVVRPDSPIKSLKDLIETAKQKPGQLNYGHPGPMTIPHLAMEELQQASGADIKDIPFRGGPQSITELLGGRLDFVSLVIGSETGQNVRMIGIFTENRHSAFPDIPTVKEQGYDVTPVSFGGLFAPPDTPVPVLAKLSQACAEAAKSEDYATIAKRQGQPANYYDDALAMRERLRRDIETKARVLSRLKTP